MLLSVFCLCSCDNFLDIQPTGKVIARTGEEYRALLTGVYYTYPDDRSLTTFRTDEFTLDPTVTIAEDLNSYFDLWRWNDITPDENTVSFSWRGYYHAIYIANYVLEHQAEIEEASPSEISQMVGECYMLRAYTHFILTNLFGKPYTKGNPTTDVAVPLYTTADVESVKSCSTVAELYNQIRADIDSAEHHLTTKKWDTTLSYRFSTIAASALKARVCLYMGKWNEALRAAESALEVQPALEDLTQNGYTMPDLCTSAENLMALEKVMKSAYKAAGIPNTEFIQSYRSGDMRKSRFFKAKTSRIYELLKGGTDQSRSTIRTAECYLTAAECALRLGEREKAMNYLTPLMEKRYLKAILPTLLNELGNMSNDQLITFVLEERSHELAFEGHRWFDLRRTTQPRLSKQYEGITYELNEGDSRYTLPLPKEAISANPNLASEQN